jgi:hypothetical protein
MTENELRLIYLKTIFKGKYSVSLVKDNIFNFISKDKYMGFSYDCCNQEFYMSGELYNFQYGYTDLNDTFKKIREQNKKYMLAYQEVKPHLEKPLNEIKIYLISRVDEIEF